MRSFARATPKYPLFTGFPTAMPWKKMTRRDFEHILEILEKRYGGWRPDHVRNRDPFQVLVGAMLSHKTRDEMTDKAHEALFNRFPTVREIASADVREIARLIKPVGFYRVKAKRIKEVAGILLERWGGGVPKSREELLKLPGVGDKTADIVLSVAYGLPEIAIDTHVDAIAKRLGIAEKDDGYMEVKRKLEELTPIEMRSKVNALLVRFGKEICRSPRPRCEVCPIKSYCRYYAEKRPSSSMSRRRPRTL